jgi:ArsR family transcriptional regulator, arsenate/arsenite/antimonite-responsive transcriptional repressor
MLKNLEAVASALSDPTRLRIVKLLAVRDLCVCQLEYLLDASQSRISQNLAILKYADLVTDTRNGRTVFYSLNREAFERAVQDLQALFGDASLDGVAGMEHEQVRWRSFPPDLAAICPAGESPVDRIATLATAGAAAAAPEV